MSSDRNAAISVTAGLLQQLPNHQKRRHRITEERGTTNYKRVNASVPFDESGVATGHLEN